MSKFNLERATEICAARAGVCEGCELLEICSDERANCLRAKMKAESDCFNRFQKKLAFEAKCFNAEWEFDEEAFRHFQPSNAVQYAGRTVSKLLYKSFEVDFALDKNGVMIVKVFDPDKKMLSEESLSTPFTDLFDFHKKVFVPEWIVKIETVLRDKCNDTFIPADDVADFVYLVGTKYEWCDGAETAVTTVSKSLEAANRAFNKKVLSIMQEHTEEMCEWSDEMCDDEACLEIEETEQDANKAGYIRTFEMRFGHPNSKQFGFWTVSLVKRALSVCKE